MKQLQKAKVIGYSGNSAIVELENGVRTYLPGFALSDVNMPINNKVYVGQVLTVVTEETPEGTTRIGHKELMVDRDTFIHSHLGDMLKARVAFTNEKGCMLEFAGNVYCHIRDM